MTPPTPSEALADRLEHTQFGAALSTEEINLIIAVLRAGPPEVKPVFQAFASGTVQWTEERCSTCGKTVVLVAKPQKEGG